MLLLVQHFTKQNLGFYMNFYLWHPWEFRSQELIGSLLSVIV